MIDGDILLGINPLLIGMGLQSGLGFLQNRSNKKQRQKEQRKIDQREAMNQLIAKLGGGGAASQAQVPQQPQGPGLLGIAASAAGDPLVQKLIADLIKKITGGGGGGQGGGGLLGRLPNRGIQGLGAGGARRR